MTEPTELMPCPFCGGNARKVKHSAGSPGTTEYDRWHGVACAGCNACVGARDRRFRTSSAAIAVWNTRTPQPTQAHIEKCAVCGDGNARLLVMRNCDVCGSDYAGQSESEVNVALERSRRATQAQSGAVPLTQYRLLEARVDRIEAGDEFLQDDAQTWATDPYGTFVGALYGSALRAARRRIKGADHA